MSQEVRLDALFHPQAVAVIGASEKPGKIGHTVVANMIEAGFPGRIYPVNPKAEEILGLPVVKDVADLPDGVDLAVITIPVAAVMPAMEILAKKQLKSAIVITAGFKEVGGEGYYLEKKLAELCRESGIALIGPNCLGMISTPSQVNASFAAGQPGPGKIAFFSQSGALCVAILDWALRENIGFSRFVSLGNKALLSEAHMLDYLRDDPHTNVILGYIENVEHGADFLRAAAAVTRQKPVIMIKSGTTAAGAKAASSHTGAIAGSDQAYAAAFKKTGIIRAGDVGTLFNLAQAFSTQPLPEGPGLVLVTNSGGPGILAADACEKSTLSMARLSLTTVERLKSFLPAYASLYNPVDIIGDADAERYRKTLAAVIDDPNVHAVLVLLCPTSSAQIVETAQAVIDNAATSSKPVFACFMGGVRVEPGRRMLLDAGIPCYAFPEPAIASIEAMYGYNQWRKTPDPHFPAIFGNTEEAAKVFAAVRDRGDVEVVEFQAQEVLRAYNLPTPRTILARSSAEAVTAAEKIGYPVVLKIASPQISHKSDVGGVRVNLDDETAVKNAFLDITARTQRLRPDAYIAGCLVQEMAPKGAREVIIGFKRDDQFGPLLMFGLGGIYVEILKDISFRLAPLSVEDARNIIREIKSYMLLKGVRGEPPVNFAAIEGILLSMSRIATDFPEVYEAEFNPVLVNHEKALVADVRLTLKA